MSQTQRSGLRRIAVIACGLTVLLVAGSAVLFAVRAARMDSDLRTLPEDSVAGTGSTQDALKLDLVFPTKTDPVLVFRRNFWASPQLAELPGAAPFLVVTASEGIIATLEPASGRTNWSLRLPCEPVHDVRVLATPVQAGDRLVVVYSCIHQHTGKYSHHAAVIDLRLGGVDDGFPIVELTAEIPASDGAGTVRFAPATHQPRSALAYIPTETGMGRVYVSFGSTNDVEAWHGWLFELDLEAWRRGPPQRAISAVFVTTSEADCDDGTHGRICGGGIWAHSGPQIHRAADGFEIVVQTGNGRLNLGRRDYAQSLLRLRPGLEFTPECNSQLCANEDPTEPSPACLESCKNLFVPRLLPEDTPLRPADGSCNNQSYLQCLELQDWDFGANAPVRIELPGGPEVYVTAGKAGDVFLVDADTLGRMYDRKQATALCGTAGGLCALAHEGAIMTQPQVGWIDGSAIVVIPTFNPDPHHSAGVIAYKIALTAGQPQLRELWRVPDPATPEAKAWFRAPPTRPVIHEFEGEPVAWVADNAAEGRVLGIRVRDGRILANVRTAGWPMRNAKPVLHRNILYLPTAFPKRDDQTWIEAYRITRRAP